MDSLYTQEEFMPADNNQMAALDQAQNIDKDTQIQLYQKYLYYNRSHNLRATRFSYQTLVDPVMIIMLNHFYDQEIRPNEFHNLDLELSLEKIVFNDLKINNM